LDLIKEGETLSSDEIQKRVKDAGIDVEETTVTATLSTLVNTKKVLTKPDRGIFHRPVINSDVTVDNDENIFTIKENQDD